MQQELQLPQPPESPVLEKIKLFTTSFMRFWWNQENVPIDEVYDDYVTTDEGRELLLQVRAYCPVEPQADIPADAKNILSEWQSKCAELEKKLEQVNDIAAGQLKELDNRDKAIKSLTKKLKENESKGQKTNTAEAAARQQASGSKEKSTGQEKE